MAIAGLRCRLALAVAGCLLFSSCTTVTDGTVQPAEGLPLGPLNAAALEEVLPTENQIADILGDRLAPDPDEPAMSGDVSDMPDGLNSEAEASPHDCVGATAPLQRSIYDGTPMTDFTSYDWQLPEGDRGDVLGTTTGVAAFPSAAKANDVFEDFVKQWEACDGTVVELPTVDDAYFTDAITNVRVENSVVSADLLTAKPSESIKWPRLRAIGVRANCLVEVDVSFFFGRDGAPSGLEDVAIELAHFMMDRIAEVG
jgi:hypothetical protein